MCRLMPVPLHCEELQFQEQQTEPMGSELLQHKHQNEKTRNIQKNESEK